MREFMKSEQFMGSKENIVVCHYDENDLDSCVVRLLFERCCPTADLSEIEKQEETNAKKS